MDIKIVTDYRDNHKLRQSFHKLAEETFGLHFESWYQNGYWSDEYNPYSIVSEGEVISNVSVNKIDCELQGQSRHYIQLGTVMTKQPFCRKGFIRMLLDKVMHDYRDCDGFFLFANDSVLDLYPKFGFTPEQEYRYFGEIKHTIPRGDTHFPKPVPMKTREDWQCFLQEKNQRYSNGILQLRTDNLLMFYLTQFMQENIYYISSLDAFIIAEVNQETLILHEVYTKEPVPVMEVCSAFGSYVKKVRFAFTPEHREGLSKSVWKDEDTTLFIAGERLREDMKRICSFPDISHA